MKTIIIPEPFQIDMDDIGWWCGSDDRKIGGPSRTGMPRPHCVEDYQAVADMGKALNMEINCSIVLGEWDMDNRLGKEIPNFSHFGKLWNNAAYRDKKAMAEAVEIMNSSPNIGIALHGLYHGYYMPGVENHDISDFFYTKDKFPHAIPENEIRLRLDHFFRLYEEHGMTSDITCFITPSGAFMANEISHILREYGIKYIATNFHYINTYTPRPDGTPYDSVYVENDVIVVDEKCRPVPWDVFDADLVDKEPCYGVTTTHWPNFLNMDSSKHSETLKKQMPFFKKCADTYGIVMSRNFAFAATQSMFKTYAKLEQIENSWVIDLADVPQASGRLDTFFISTKTPPVKFENCTLSEVQEKTDFINYEIKPEGKIVKIHF